MNNDKGMTEKYIGQKGFLKSKIFKVKKNHEISIILNKIYYMNKTLHCHIN
jgi:hypothetical protein